MCEGVASSSLQKGHTGNVVVVCVVVAAASLRYDVFDVPDVSDESRVIICLILLLAVN